MNEFVDQFGRRWTYDVEGTGPVAIFLHGVGASRAAWRDIAKRLASERTCVVLDVPGFGLGHAARSPVLGEMAFGLDHLIESVTVERPLSKSARGVDVVGHSLGATLALTYGYLFPDSTRSLTLIAPAGFGPEVNPLLFAISRPTGLRLLSLLYRPAASQMIERMAGAYALSAFGKRRRTQEAMLTYKALADPSNRRSLSDVAGWVLSQNTPDQRAVMAALSLSRPILVIWGRRDQVLPAWQSAELLKAHPHALISIMPDEAHTPHRSNPEGTATHIRRFWGHLSTKPAASPQVESAT